MSEYIEELDYLTSTCLESPCRNVSKIPNIPQYEDELAFLKDYNQWRQETKLSLFSTFSPYTKKLFVIRKAHQYSRIVVAYSNISYFEIDNGSENGNFFVYREHVENNESLVSVVAILLNECLFSLLIHHKIEHVRPILGKFRLLV